MKTKLHPCPFCGSSKVRILDYHTEAHVGECRKCGATGPLKNTGRKAVNAWNKSRLSKPEEWVVKAGSDEPYFELYSDASHR
jgi:Lar family restriction alleviation protein